MNIKDLEATITSHYAHKLAQVTDGAAYAYVKGQLAWLEEHGLDPTEYEVIFVRDEYPQTTEDGMKITQRIRLVKTSQVAGISENQEES